MGSGCPVLPGLNTSQLVSARGASRTVDRGPPVTEALAYGVAARIGGLGRVTNQLVRRPGGQVLTQLRGLGSDHPRS